MTIKSCLAAVAVILPLVLPLPLAGQMTGYSAAARDAQRSLEADAISRPSADSAAAFSKALSRESHVAGTPAQVKTRDYVLQHMKAWGLETESREYSVWLPHPTLVQVSRVSPSPLALDLAEPRISVDPSTFI